MNDKKETKPMVILVLFIIGFLLFGYIGLLAGAYSKTHEDVALLIALFKVPELITTTPFAIFPFDKQALMFSEVAYLLICLIIYANFEMNKRTTPGKEYGSAKFMTPSEKKDWRKKFMNQQIYTEGLPSKHELKNDK